MTSKMMNEIVHGLLMGVSMALTVWGVTTYRMDVVSVGMLGLVLVRLYTIEKKVEKRD